MIIVDKLLSDDDLTSRTCYGLSTDITRVDVTLSLSVWFLCWPRVRNPLPHRWRYRWY